MRTLPRAGFSFLYIMSTKPNIHISGEAFTTESGFTIEKPVFAYHSWGNLNKEKNNVVVIFHALTGHSNAEEWFSGFFRPESGIDPARQFVICINQLGSCYGSSGPLTENPRTGRPYKNEFPEVTIRDQARFQQLLLDDLGINGIELVIGGSMGGMTALEFSILDRRVEKACFMAMGKAHSPWAIGISHAQRLAIYSDPNWNNGSYSADNPPANGLKAARAMAMITYRCPENYQDKFQREHNAPKNLYEVESYLEYQGDKLVQRFDALSYVLLSKAMDSHDISRGRGTFRNVLSKLTIPVLVIGIDTDNLYPTSEQKELAGLVPGAEYAEIKSNLGHDAFLLEFEQINAILSAFLSKYDLIKSA